MSVVKTAEFDIKRLIKDLGGPAKVAKITGKTRTTPYRWMAQGFISTKVLERIKEAEPHIDLDLYFKK